MALAGQPADDAATLAFGPEFPLDSCECLSDAEVTTILDTHLRSSAAADRPFPRLNPRPQNACRNPLCSLLALVL